MELELNAQVREEKGNKSKALREKGFIPAVVYGPGHKPASLQLDYQEFRRIFDEAGESTLIKLKIKNEKLKKDETKNVLIHEVARDPITDKFIHADFLQVRMDKVITTEVPLVFEGEAPVVKNLDGVLIKNIIEVEIEALPKDLPHEIKVDVSSLEAFDDHIRIKDLKLPEGVKILADIEESIVSVAPPRTKEELEELEEKPKEVVEEAEKVEAPTEVGVPTEVGKEKPEEPTEEAGQPEKE